MDLSSLRASRGELEERLRVIDEELTLSKTKARSAWAEFYNAHQDSVERISDIERTLTGLVKGLEVYDRKEATDARSQFAKEGKALRQERAASAIEACIKHADNLSRGIIGNVTRDLDTALAQMHRLWQFCTALRAVQGAMSLVFIDHLLALSRWTWTECIKLLGTALLQAAEAFGWPTPIRTIIIGKKTAQSRHFEDAFINLLRFQDECPSQSLSNDTGPVNTTPLYPIQELIRPIILRFRFHFDRKTSTNRIDKPEWMFSQVVTILQEHAPLMKRQIQVLLKGSPFEGRDAWTEMAKVMQTILSAKLKVITPVLLPKKQDKSVDNEQSPVYTSGLLSHLVYQTLQYDSKIQSLGLVLPPLVEDILGNKAWYDAWLEAEKDFARARYEEITFASDAWHLESEVQAIYSSDLRPSRCVARLANLLTTITDRYRPLPHFKYQAPFLLDIQVDLLESMETRLGSVIEAFESLNSSLFRKVASTTAHATGASVSTGKEDPVASLARMARCWTSAKWLAAFCRSWSEDGFFLVLWQKITSSTKTRSPAGTQQDDESQTGLFYALAAVFEKDARRVESMMKGFVVREIKNTSREYFGLRDWARIGDDDDEAKSITPSLQPALSVYATLLGTLSVYLPSSDLTTIHATIVDEVTSLNRHRLIERNNWSRGGVKRLVKDIENGWMAVSEAIAPSPTSRERLASPIVISIGRGPDYDKPSDIHSLRRPSKAWRPFLKATDDITITDLDITRRSK